MYRKLSMHRGKLIAVLTVLALLALLVTPMLALAAGKNPEGYAAPAHPKTAGTKSKYMAARSMAATSPAGGDGLYVSYFGDDTVKRFDAKTGAYLNTFVAPGSGGLLGPHSAIFFAGKLDVVNQNVSTDYNGEILQYDVQTGAFVNALVGCNPPIKRDCDPNAPFAPQQMVAGPGQTLYVADQQGPGGGMGRIAQYDSVTGAFLRNLSTTGFTGTFYPRGIVTGPDGLLYVSVTGNLGNGEILPGWIARFNPITGNFVDVFASEQGPGCAADMHRPFGLVFGPDGNLYVGAFRANATDTDKILVFDGKTGACLKKIDLDKVGQARTYSNGMVFGPGGRLFVAIFTTGDVRRYNVSDGSFDVFVSSAGMLGLADQLSFRNTNPRTLAYEP